METECQKLYALNKLDKYGQNGTLWLAGVRLPTIPAISGNSVLAVLQVFACAALLAIVRAILGARLSAFITFHTKEPNTDTTNVVGMNPLLKSWKVTGSRFHGELGRCPQSDMLRPSFSLPTPAQATSVRFLIQNHLTHGWIPWGGSHLLPSNI